MSERVKEILGWMRDEARHVETSTSVEASYHAHMLQVIEVLAKEMDGLRDGLDHHTHGVLYEPRNKTPDRTVEQRYGNRLVIAVRHFLSVWTSRPITQADIAALELACAAYEQAQ